MRAAFASALQSCDELQHSGAVTRFFIAEAGTSITIIVRFTSVSSPKCLFRRHVSSYIYFSGKHVLPAEMSSSIIANTSLKALLQVS